MTPRIRTLNFLPDIFRTTTNSQFLSATLDQVVQQPRNQKIEGYIGSKFGYGVNAKDKYVTEPNKTRTNYQLDPGVVFLNKDTEIPKDFLTYPGLLDGLKLENGIVNDNNRLFESEFYSWDSFTDLDKIINFHQYYWVPTGPEAVVVSTETIFNNVNYIIDYTPNGYIVSVEGDEGSNINPTLQLLRGCTYYFKVNQSSNFWIQGFPGLTGVNPAQSNIQTRDVIGVTNNGISNGVVRFDVPQSNSLEAFQINGNLNVDLVSTLPFNAINGQLLNSLNQGIDGVTSLNGLTLMFYETGTIAQQSNFYTISYSGNPLNPTLNLTPTSPIPSEEKIYVKYGTEYISKNFYRNSAGFITLIPYNSTILDTLYYQDGSSVNSVGKIQIFENNLNSLIDVDKDILGKKQYTSPNGVVFTNGLKVLFQGNTTPSSYIGNEYYVQGVGTSIELLSVPDLISPESFTSVDYFPYDLFPYDIGNFDAQLYIPTVPDYITIARNAINRNPWSRSNRWFHIQVLEDTAKYNNDPNLLSAYTQPEFKAKRPIIEFYPNLKLYNTGVKGKDPITFFDTRTTDALNEVEGQLIYYPDVEVYTNYSATILPVTGNLVRTAIQTIVDPNNTILLSSTIGFHVNDPIVFTGTTFGGIVNGTTYYILEVVNTTTIKISATEGGEVFELTSGSGTMTATVTPLSTEVTVSASNVTGNFQIGQFIADSKNGLPSSARITKVTTVSGITTIVASWSNFTTVNGYSNVSIVANDVSNDNYELYEGATIVFSKDANIEVRNKIFVARYTQTSLSSNPVITLSVASEGEVLDNEQVVVFTGYNNQGQSFYFKNNTWIKSQQKTRVNQPPLYDIFDYNGISFSDESVYEGTTFKGNYLFSYGLGVGSDDPILGFPLKYSNVQNVGDISFDVNFNKDTFDYIDSVSKLPKQLLVNTGYVYNYSSIENYVRQIGWQTAIGPSVQYQIFEFDYFADTENLSFTLDVAMLAESTWPTLQVFVNNTVTTLDFTVTVNQNSTVVTFDSLPSITNTVIQIAVLSNQVSSIAYYGIPINLNNNPLNADITQVNIGDIRGQYQSIFLNNPNTSGPVFGANNYRDLGNLVPYGNKIIQNSASLVLPGAFLRQQNHNLFNALGFNSSEYVNFKTLLINTVFNTEYNRYQTAAFMLDDALEQISATKTDGNSFFWSDMLPSKSAFITNTYNFNNLADTSIFPLSKIYDFTKANYNGVLVYLTRANVITQLMIGIDYTVSQDSPSLIVTLDLIPNDVITIKEYNQTYGSFVPNTPTKLGLYPKYVPNIVLDADYSQPTYFILGHDGSYTKLYGSYDPTTGQLQDFRDEVLLEFEKRIFNNLKLDNIIPLTEQDIIPGFFRETDYSYNEIQEIYSVNFLNWIGQNRIDYKTQFYNANNQYTYNYNRSGNKINNGQILQGYWRGVYNYFYDTFNPDTTPWEMLGFSIKPTWWNSRYGPAPYTSDNLILWDDLAQGINYNNGNPVVLSQYARPELLKVLPVDSQGNLVSPFVSIVGNYSNQSFIRDWKVGDIGPAELSYRRSSSWPFDLMKIFALTKPAQFFNLSVDIDNYKFNSEFNQYLVNNRSHLVISNIDVYGSGTAKTSYINWIVDYEKQFGVDATANIETLLKNLDVRLIYRVAGFTDKDLLKFYVEKGTPNSTNASLLIPDESYSVLLYDNQPFDKIIYSGVIIQQTIDGYFKIYGNSQLYAYFRYTKPKINGNFERITIGNISVQIPRDFTTNYENIAYGTELYSVQEVANFLTGYGHYLIQQGVKFAEIEAGIEVNWNQMISEFLYWAQSGWEPGSLINLNPAAKVILIEKESSIVQPLTLQQQNFILNQNLYPIQSVDLSVVREGTAFSAKALNEGDTIAYGQFNLFNFEHGIVFNNITLFDDIIYNLITGLRQNRIYVRGTKSAEWNGTVDAQGFILNQDNIKEYNQSVKYTKGEIVKYKNKFWTALKIIQPKTYFEELEWKETDYNEIQKGLLPNSSTRSYESTLYYDSDKANLERDADLLSFSLIGYRPRDYLALADLTDITQINVYKNLIKNKGTRNSTEAFKGAVLAQGGIEYDIYENWAIKSGEFGALYNSNFIELKLNEPELTSNPNIVGLTNGTFINGVQQQVPLNRLFNYSKPVFNVNVLPTTSTIEPSKLYPDAGYVNFNDVKTSSFFFSGLSTNIVPLNQIYVGDYIWIANQQGKWNVVSPISAGQIIRIANNISNILNVTFLYPHNLVKNQSFGIVNFSTTFDGYYIVNNVIDPYTLQTTIDADLDQETFTGNGICLAFSNHRVTYISDISSLPLLQNEFYKNKVWVDVGTSGGWEVVRKSINYQIQGNITLQNSATFGSSVLSSNEIGYLITDATLGELYRYTYNPLENEYTLFGSKVEAPSYGTAMANAGKTYIISQPTGATANDRKVFVYRLDLSITINDLIELQEITAPNSGVTNWGSSIAISGDEKWIYISDTVNNRVYVYNLNPVTDLYEYATYISSTESSAGDNFGNSIATTYYGDRVIIGAPNNDLNGSVLDVGKTYVFDRYVQKFIAQFSSVNGIPVEFDLASPPIVTVTTVTATTSSNNSLTIADTSILSVGIPVAFSGNIISAGAITPNSVYFVKTIIDSTRFTVSLTRGGSNVLVINDSGTMTMNIQSKFPYVIQNGNLLTDNNYFVVGNTLSILSTIQVGDLIEVSVSNFVEAQRLTTINSTRSGSNFGFSVATTSSATEILVGSIYEQYQGNEGVVYRFTDSSRKYGYLTGTSNANLTGSTTLLINGTSVTLAPGNATSIANQIVGANITNVTASATNGKLTINILDKNLSTPNNLLTVIAPSMAIWAELGINLYTRTQIITSPRLDVPTQFGYNIKFNQYGSFVVSAPVSDRFVGTTFDQTDDENFDNDTIFDNNSTQFVDTYSNAGAVYMYDYLSNYNENLSNVGKFVYAQSINDIVSNYGNQPYYGQSLYFNEYTVIVGTPLFKVGPTNGKVIIFNNNAQEQDWILYRQSSPVVDIRKLQNIQLFSAITNETLENLDFIDPLQGKILGIVRENIDVVSNVDPASYNSPDSTTKDTVAWGEAQLGELWFNTSNVRFVNYHQDDVVYNSEYWGTIFPGSDVAVYSWIASDVSPIEYRSQGIPFSIDNYVIQYKQDARGNLVPVYYFWVRNSNVIFTKRGKTLSDTVLESYIENAKLSGVSYFAPLSPSTFALYNSFDYINNNDTILHIGYLTGNDEDVSHSVFNLIRVNYADDFLPGLPNTNSQNLPQSLYDRMLDSMVGVDETGAIVPDPYLPKAVQIGVYARPRQSFFLNRFNALKNYLTYANEILSQFPITEIRNNLTFLQKVGPINPTTNQPSYDVTSYWSYINWWAPGYDNNTKSAIQVSIYADLSALSVPPGTIVTVAQNSAGLTETYVLNTLNIWDRIGLQNGTIQFSSGLWDYSQGNYGFGSNFYDTSPYDYYPSEETRLILRALNEQIFVDELLIQRNRSLILLFEYAQSETIESQNYLPWLNKTSLVDITHTIRELRPIENFQSDNEIFLESYLKEAKPYHVVIKDFVFKYTGTDIFEGDITDFDLPAQFDFAVNQFVTPMLVKNNPNNSNEFAIDNRIWQTTPYNQWYQNRGLTIVGVSNYNISILAVYMERNSNSIYVENINSFPVAGTVKIDNEIIVYSAIDRVNNRLFNLTRGYESTDITTHLPGQPILIDLPPITLLDSGRGYIIPPRITAYIDLELYPAPTREARFEAVMNLDKLLYINTIDPGDGYEVLPEIIIEPSMTVTFQDLDVLLYINGIRLSNPILQTGDLVKYKVGDNTTKVGGLYKNQYYYINVIDVSPNFVICLYLNYADAINDNNRVQLRNQGSGVNNYLELSARATCVSDVSPIRENKLTLKYDRTTYNPNVVDWTPGSWYSSFYAGQYKTQDIIASSTASLAAEIPPVTTIASSLEGASFQISAVTSVNEIIFSSRTRTVVATTGGVNLITLAPSPGGAPDEGFVSPTTGFYFGMPIKFEGTAFGGLFTGVTYYVASIASGTEITVSLTQGSTISVNLNTSLPLNPFYAFPSKEENTTIITIDYPGIRPSTSTNGNNDTVTIPLTFSGLGGTSGLFPSVPVFFVGNVFGNIVQNEIYYVSTVLSNTTMTLMTDPEPLLVNILSIEGSTNVITCESTSMIGINDPIIFTSMVIAGVTVTDFGNIQYGVRYFINSIVNATQFTIKPFVNYPIFDLATVVAASNTGCIGTNQRFLLDLSTATGNMTLYIGLPLSPGQLEGQRLDFYKTNNIGYSGVTGTNSDLLSRKISATVSNGNNIGITTASGGLTNLYVNMPIRLASAIGGLSTGVTYYIKQTGTVTTPIISTSSTGNEILGGSTQGFFVGMLISFSGLSGFGNLQVGVAYYIKTIVDSERFTISQTLGGPTLTLVNAVGTLTLTGEPFIRLSNTLGGSVISVTDAAGPATLNQYITSTPSFNVTYELGGYFTVIVSGGTGYTIGNKINISGANLGGTDPKNDLVLLVDNIGVNGQITKTISYGTPVGPERSFYVDVITSTQCKLYYDILKKVPVPISDFPYVSYDYGFLPEPFLFEQSIVKYNNKIWECVVSNDDDEFIVGKWELVGSDDRRLNALDRISGYYQPTANMPGNDITQLVTGTTYPYITYAGNAFSPEDEFALDTELIGGTFTVENINSASVVWNGINYVGAINSDYSGIMISPATTKNWVIEKITEQSVNVTDIAYSGSRYVVTTNNAATPILTSTNLTTWTGGYPAYPVFAQALTAVAYHNNVWVTVGTNILRSTNGINWNQTYNLDLTYVQQFKNVYGASITNFNGFIAIGSGQHLVGSTITNKGLIFVSIDNGQSWTEPVPNMSTSSFNGITSGNNLLVIVGSQSVVYYSNNGYNWIAATNIGSSANLVDVAFGNSIFVAIGNNGVIKTSTDLDNWTNRTSNTTENLNSIVFNSTNSEFLIVGNNNTILSSVDGITWTSVNDFQNIGSVYDVQGQPFMSGYGPEELVPGVVSDNLQMIITTRPGTTWSSQEYQHVGYNVISETFTPVSGTEVTFSFDGIVETPAMISVWILDNAVNLLAKRLFLTVDYTVNWVNKTFTLTTAPVLGNKIYIEVYEVGNGNQLVKSSTDYEPIRENINTGFKQILLGCNYSGIYYQGSGVIRNLTTGVNVIVTATSAIDNSFLCASVDNFVVNNIITFQGAIFGGVSLDTNYYVKTVSTATNKITISATLVSGVAGPTFIPSTASGSMDAVIQEGSGLVWTDPIIHHNGNRLVLGTTTRVTRTSSLNNAITCNSTSGLSIGDKIMFSNTMFGIISPLTTYFVKTIVDANEFTISTTLGGSILTLTDAIGGATAITNDYAFNLNENGVNADLVLASQYSKNTDFLTYTVFGEVIPYSIGYTLPETEVFIGDGSISVFNLTYNVTGDNPQNAIVEINGLRISNTLYTIDDTTDTITFTSAPNLADKISVTSFNETERQYFSTTYDITGKQVSNIIAISNNITPPTATVLCTATSAATNEITCVSTADMLVNQQVYFNAPAASMGGIDITDTVYYILAITSPTTFTISTTQGGPVFVLTNGAANIFAYVGGQPAIRVTTGISHNFVTNDIVRIDGTEGSVQLNNNTYYARVIDSTTFDLYSSPYTQSYTGTNNPVTGASTYTSDGYVWLDKSFVLVTTTATATTAITNFITVSSSSKLVVGTPIIFTGTTFGGIVQGTTYYITVISGSNIKISQTRGGDNFAVTTSSGSMNVTQWEQSDVDRLWITVNGYRVPSMYLKINPDNNISILTLIQPADVITIMSMMPSATPNEMVYLQTVDKNNTPSVYRADNLLTTWLVQDLLNSDSTIYLDDVSHVVAKQLINATVPGDYNSLTNPFAIELNVDKSLISGISVHNNTTNSVVPSTNYKLEIINLSPVLVINGSINIGNSLTITVTLGNTIFLNGEQIRFTTVNFANNSITGLQRGANGTGEQIIIPKYTRVYGELVENKLPTIDYNLTWNSNIYNTVQGDPLQISLTQSAIFLRTYRS